MRGQPVVWGWLVYSAVLSGVVLALGAAAVLACRQPVYRLRLIRWVLIGCVVTPWLHSLSPWTPFSLRLLNDQPEIIAVAPAPLAVADRGNRPETSSSAAGNPLGERGGQPDMRGMALYLKNTSPLGPQQSIDAQA